MFNYRQSAGKINSIAYLFGVYLGDGNVSRGDNYDVDFRLNTIDYDFAQAVQDALFNVIGRIGKIYTYPVKKSTKPNNYIRLGCKDFCDYLEAETLKKEKLPDFIWKASKKTRKEFIAGLMDSEGYICKDKRSNFFEIGFKTTSEWTKDVNRLLQLLGCETSLKECKPYKSWYKKCYRIRIKPQSFIKSNLYFKIQRKQDRVNILRDYTLYGIRPMI
ncbi:MAG: LAGLIDADG family homing endonuclease [Patescibacteria group bacterium]